MLANALKSLLVTCVTVCLVAQTTISTIDAQQQRLTPELLWKLGRLGDATVSPDGESIAYAVRRYDLAANSGTSSVFLAQADAETLTVVQDWRSIGSLHWLENDGHFDLVFSGMRGDEETPVLQAWQLNLANLHLAQMTDFEAGIANLKVSPTGRHIAFTQDVKLDQTVNELYEDLPLADARIIDSLMYRHWNQWHDYKYSHLHVAELDENGQVGEPRDLMEEIRADCPVPPFAGAEQFAWSPDGTELAFTMKAVENWAESTNSDVYIVSASGGIPRNITAEFPGYDNDPVYSPDGQQILFHSMKRPGFESDRNRIMVYDRSTGSISEATESLDQTVHGAKWFPDGGFAYTSEHRGTNQIFGIGGKFTPDAQAKTGEKISKGLYNYTLLQIVGDGSRGLVSYMSMLQPAELGMLDFATGDVQPISNINGDLLQSLQKPAIEERWVTATDGEKIHCWVIYPPDFDVHKKYPLLLYCQGGPQGQIGQWFSFRWNFMLMASHDYIIVAPNRRGLPGFGRAWNDQISGDWGGQAMQDLLAATDDMLVEDYVDPDRVGAIGASFGGYTIYWLMGNAGDRFQTMIAHCGVFNLESMYGSTEELFFVNWDLGGPYWANQQIQQDYNRFSPHRFVQNWKTPLLVIHGQKDFRVPVTQGMEAFTAAQVNRIESRFLYFPNEGHWVLGPQNGVLWHRVFFDWLDRFLK